jgi:hypothetical protein
MYYFKTETFTPIEKTWPEKLKKELFTDYDKTIRPCEDTKATTVNFGLTIMKFDLVSIVIPLTAYLLYLPPQELVASTAIQKRERKLNHM